MATDTAELNKSFDAWLKERRDNLTLRQQFWLAWKAGAEWALDEVRRTSGLPPRDPE